MSSRWAAEAAAVFVKDWRCELRTRHAVSTLVLFALTTLIVASLILGPIGNDREMAQRVVPVLVWLILLFAAAAGLPRAFVHEEESRTAIALRLAARPSALFAGKLLHVATLVAILQLLVTPLAVVLFDLPVAQPVRFVAALALPILLPALTLAVAASRVALTGIGEGDLLTLLVLYDGSIVVAGFLLFPAIWNP